MPVYIQDVPLNTERTWLTKSSLSCSAKRTKLLFENKQTSKQKTEVITIARQKALLKLTN